MARAILTLATVILFSLGLCLVARADGPVLVVTDTGYYLLTVGADGVPVPTPITQIVIIGRPAPPVPPTADLPSKVKGWLTSVPEGSRGNTAGIANVIARVVELINSGAIENTREADALLAFLLGNVIVDKAGWSQFGKNLTDEIKAQMASGKIKTAAEYAAVLALVVKGLK